LLVIFSLSYLDINNLVYVPISVLSASINFFICIIVLKQPKGSKILLHLVLNLVVGKVVEGLTKNIKLTQVQLKIFYVMNASIYHIAFNILSKSKK